MFLLRPVCLDTRNRALITLALLWLTPLAWAQESDSPIRLEKPQIVERIAELLSEHYVFPEVANRAGERLRVALRTGELDSENDPTVFARLVTETLQEVSRDKHLRVRVRPAERATLERENPVRARARARDRERQSNYGFEKVERLDGNVGYVDLRYFSGAPEARTIAQATFGFLQNVDALIFDMRRNGGGNPDMVRFVCSHLFDGRVHLNSLYWRRGDRTQEFWTLEELSGPRLTDVPVFVLSSSRTFSGAEEFCYNLQTRKRATLIGETTGGGANPGGTFRIDERFGIFIPTGRAINPVTGTNWEGVGVVPDVTVDADDALEVALERAREAAANRRSEKEIKASDLWQALAEAESGIADPDPEAQKKEAESLIPILERALRGNLLGELDINQVGYDYLGRRLHVVAIEIFRLNVREFPASFNVYDSLGEAYMNAGQTKAAIRNYQKSLEIDPTNTNAETMIERMQSNTRRF